MTAKAFIEGVVAAKDPKCPLASALRLYIAHYFRSSAPRYGLVDPASRLAFRIERPRRSRKGSKKTAATVEIKPPVQDGINNPVVVRQDSNVQVLSGKFLGRKDAAVLFVAARGRAFWRTAGAATCPPSHRS